MTTSEIVALAVLALIGLPIFAGIMIHAVRADLVERCILCRHPLPEGIHGLCDRCCDRSAERPPHSREQAEAGAERAAAEVILDTPIVRLDPPRR